MPLGKDIPIKPLPAATVGAEGAESFISALVVSFNPDGSVSGLNVARVVTVVVNGVRRVIENESTAVAPADFDALGLDFTLGELAQAIYGIAAQPVNPGA
jgi:hypothetical protein